MRDGRVSLVRRGSRRRESVWAIKAPWTHAELARAGLERAISKVGRGKFRGTPVGLAAQPGGRLAFAFRFQSDAGMTGEKPDFRLHRGLSLVAEALVDRPGVVIVYTMRSTQRDDGREELTWAF